MNDPASPPEPGPAAGPGHDTAQLDRFFEPVLALAVAVARERAAEDGAAAVPARLRPFLRVPTVPKAGLTAARLAVEEDPELRAAVADRVTEADVGRGPWLWVARPDGWRDDLEGEWELWREAESRRIDEAAERSSSRLLERSAATIARLEGRVAQLESVLATTEADLVRARTEAAGVIAERDVAVTEARRFAEERAEAVRQLKRTEELLVSRTAELREVEDLLAEDAATAAPPAPGPVPDEVADAVRHLAVQLDPLARSLQRVVDALGLDPLDVGGGQAARRRRRPARIGRGIPEDSTTAAEVLLGLPGVVVLVDGYNVTMTVWPSLGAAEQRRALERSLAGLAGRTGAEVVVVFDGIDGAVPPARTAPAAVRVRFTPADVEADDEILDLVAATPADRPVVVVSDDRRVQRGARSCGANVVGVRQLQPLLLR